MRSSADPESTLRRWPALQRGSNRAPLLSPAATFFDVWHMVQCINP